MRSVALAVLSPDGELASGRDEDLNQAHGCAPHGSENVDRSRAYAMDYWIRSYLQDAYRVSPLASQYLVEHFPELLCSSLGINTALAQPALLLEELHGSNIEMTLQMGVVALKHKTAALAQIKTKLSRSQATQQVIGAIADMGSESPHNQ